MSSGTLKRFTASSSFGTYRMAVVGDCNPPVRAAVLQPLFVAPFGLEQVAVSFNEYPSISEDARKLLSEVAVGEVDPAHAVRE